LHYHYDTREDLLLAFVDNLVGWIDARLDETDTTDPRALSSSSTSTISR
jgi:AcrR family transcriptional regulator